MQITCKTNHIQDVERKLRSFAFTQDEKGQVDLTIENTRFMATERIVKVCSI